jgi:hypothetical protein
MKSYEQNTKLDLPIMANDRSNFFSLALTMSSESLFYTMIIPTEEKSARSLTLELISKSELSLVFIRPIQYQV